MKSKCKVMVTIIMVLSLVVIGSLGSFANAQDRVQARDRDYLEEPNHKYCDQDSNDCDHDEDKDQDRDKDQDQDHDRLNLSLLDFESDQYRIRECLTYWGNDGNLIRLRNRMTQILLLSI